MSLNCVVFKFYNTLISDFSKYFIPRQNQAIYSSNCAIYASKNDHSLFSHGFLFKLAKSISCRLN